MATVFSVSNGYLLSTAGTFSTPYTSPANGYFIGIYNSAGTPATTGGVTVLSLGTTSYVIIPPNGSITSGGVNIIGAKYITGNFNAL